MGNGDIMQSLLPPHVLNVERILFYLCIIVWILTVSPMLVYQVGGEINQGVRMCDSVGMVKIVQV